MTARVRDAQRSIIRPDDKGEVDDVVISGDLFRMERMDTGYWWLAIYRGDKRVAFALTTNRNAKISAFVTEDDFGCRDDTLDTSPLSSTATDTNHSP